MADYIDNQAQVSDDDEVSSDESEEEDQLVDNRKTKKNTVDEEPQPSLFAISAIDRELNQKPDTVVLLFLNTTQ